MFDGFYVFVHGDLEMENSSNVIFITSLGDKTENVKKVVIA